MTIHAAIERSELIRVRADVSTAVRIAAPYWPLSSFVAVNPLGSFEHLPFDDACQRAERWYGARTHLSIAEFRSLHRQGSIRADDLQAAIETHVSRVDLGGVADRASRVDVAEVILADVLHGPTQDQESHGDLRRGSAGQWGVAVADYVGSWCAAFVSGDRFEVLDRADGLFASWQTCAPFDPALRRLVGRGGRSTVGRVPSDAALALAGALRDLGVGPDERIEALRTIIARLPGWIGYARWCDEWASPDHNGPRIRTIDMVALLTVLELAGGPKPFAVTPPPALPDRDSLRRRTDAVIGRLGPVSASPDLRDTVETVLSELPDRARRSVWLRAHERSVRRRLLTLLDQPKREEPRDRPDAQFMACIDVRSEALRRNLEARGSYETIGFAGFFGVPIRWRPLGSSQVDPRSPVLVTPHHEIRELPASGDTSAEEAHRLARAASDAAKAAKADLGAPFALAESVGWITGPLAAFRTLWPGRDSRLSTRVQARSGSHTDMTTRSEDHTDLGLSLEVRALFAEAILSTVGMARFAPLVMLCGHGSATVNNPHASALDCGACGGAPGGANARVACDVLNDPLVRAELRTRGIDIAADTWFVAAQHDTASDQILVLDRHRVPRSHLERLAALERDLAEAGAATSAERARRLPGDPTSVRRRGRDWAQVRPEWGLAGNAAIVIGPRSITRGIDLAGRVFLHDYHAETDPMGTALETILTAPLIVAHWISSQYYFSTVDPWVFGAGDKMLHNPVGGVGVMLGQSGDLAVGLPSQSVRFGQELAHEPVRLVALVQAPLERIEMIIQRNRTLHDLLTNEWITLAGRPNAAAPWAFRSPNGAWEVWEPVAAESGESFTVEIATS